ncbi:MAG TPA: hypothetical protein VM889_11465 [Candidatus Thermoplasmatota archaeon]|nr:hypothetical protein [Candidatus Thermoplasmatota archaeon]
MTIEFSPVQGHQLGVCIVASDMRGVPASAPETIRWSLVVGAKKG